MDTATVAVIASSTVALASLAANVWQHKRGLDHQRELVDLDNVRHVLDDAAVTLHKVAYALDDVCADLIQHRGVKFFKTEVGTAKYQRLQAHGEALDALVERLSVRLGRDHTVVRQVAAADAAVLKFWTAVGGLRREPESDGSPSAEHQIREFEDEQKATIGLNRERFNVAREGFVGSANKIAGARLR